MTKTAKNIETQFRQCIDKIISCPVGRESTMYGPIRDLLTEWLGYPKPQVDIDTIGEGGRPDVTVFAASPFSDRHGRPKLIPWIVVEAKDEPGAFAVAESREAIFAEKQKYIATDTAWFVMIEPTILVARPVQSIPSAHGPAAGDIEFRFNKSATETVFKTKLAPLRHEIAGVPERLKQFRTGDVSIIATDKLTSDKAADKKSQNAVRLYRRNFFNSISETTENLQWACGKALAAIKPEIDEITLKVEQFSKAYNGIEFSVQPMMVRGHPKGLEQSKKHERDAAVLRRFLSRRPAIAKLAIEGLPGFKSRTGADDEILEGLFATETANLILARILLLRFFEDHGFFGKHRYVCNGGIKAFQGMREYFDAGYTRLLEDAYRSASKLYSAAFDSTELDWVLGIEDPNLSSAIEWSLFKFSRFDFRTVKGDILTGIYDRFLDRDQRKRLGEFYTSPSVAKFIVERTGIKRESKVFEPACGSGTFLIEAFDAMVGEDARRGAADWGDITKAFERLCGNDINTFSAVLAQIQLLWQILPFRSEIEEHGFPEIRITEKVNSLVVPSLDSPPSNFSEIDQQDYDAVISNPPYIRAERSSQDLDSNTVTYFEGNRGAHSGISSKANAYALFLYRALDSWCRVSAPGQSAGRVGFVIPISFCDSNENADIRKLFMINQRWTILEIVDLESIYNYIFDAWTYPIILIAEARPATADDKVTVRLADPSHIKPSDHGVRPIVDFEGMPRNEIPYADLFTKDGRIMTRLTPRRAEIIRKLEANDVLESAAKTIWLMRRKNQISAWTDDDPQDPRWQARKLIAGGIAFRGQKGVSAEARGLDVYKGENIISGELQGKPQKTGIDILSVDDPSLWIFGGDKNDLSNKPNVLPKTGFAVPQLVRCPVAAPFDPSKIAFMNTVTLFFPREELQAFPFDLLFLSKVYRFFYAIGARMGVIRAAGSHVYPTNLKMLPWNGDLQNASAELSLLRTKVTKACVTAHNVNAEMLKAVEALKLASLKDVIAKDKKARLFFSESFAVSGHDIVVVPSKPTQSGDDWIIHPSSNLVDWIGLNRKEIADGLFRSLQIVSDSTCSRNDIMRLPIPLTSEQLQAWDNTIQHYKEFNHEAAMEDAITEIDGIVAGRLGLTADDVAFIGNDLKFDPFLKLIKPRFPGTQTRKFGFLKGLDSSERYE